MTGVGVEWQDHNLPIPNYIEYTNNGYAIAWQIDGFFATDKGIAYLNDVIGRVLITFKENNPHRLPYKPDLRSADHYYPLIRKLSALANLQSLPNRKKSPSRADSFSDHAFWAIKLYTEDRIREFGEGTPVPYQAIEDWAIVEFVEEKGKEKSTIRAKCRSIWNWYDQRDWQLPKNERGFEMSRTEHIKKVHENRRIQTRNKIKAVLDDIFMQDQIKKKNGKLKIKAIAELAEIDQRTVSEHLKEMGLI